MLHQFSDSTVHLSLGWLGGVLQDRPSLNLVILRQVHVSAQAQQFAGLLN